MMEDPGILYGGIAVDDRGTLSFVNDFAFAGIKRFYQVGNFSTDVIRAFHGHKKETKFVLVVKGSAIVAAVEFDDDAHPSKEKKIHRFVLSDKKPGILRIPAGYANGFKPLEEDTRIIFFSSSTLEESKGDDFRFPFDYWGKDIWETENR